MQPVIATNTTKRSEPAIKVPPVPKGGNRWQIPLLIALTIASLALFVDRAFNVDEPLFIWVAHQICQKPLDFYGFSVNWYSAMGKMAQIMKNPPLASYYIALASKIVGWSEIGLHIAFWPPAVGLILGVFRLAQLRTSRPLAAALLRSFRRFS